MPISTNNSRKASEKRVICLTIILTIVINLTGCGLPLSGGAKGRETVQRSGLMLDTVVTVTLYGGGDTQLIDRCFEKCREYELIFSRTDPDSELYRLNRDRSMEVSAPLLELLETALYYCRLSGGAFDITLGAVSDMYGFSSDSPAVPTDDELAEAMPSGYECIRIEGSTVTLTDDRAVIDLGAIAKGYIADRLGELLRENGQDSAIISLGGNVLCVGEKPGGEDFAIGIQYPFADYTRTISTVYVKDMSVVTSGIYERSFEYEGELYHHILDAATGRPVQNGLVAVSIVSPLSVDGDALSTVCFALGLEKGLELIDSLDGVYAVFVTDDLQLHPSQGFDRLCR